MNKALCEFPLCKSPEYRAGFCINHAKYYAKEEVKKVVVPIAKKSTKRKQDDKEYKKLSKEILSKEPNCKIKSPVCTGKAEGLDHLQKRSPKNLLERTNLVPACNACQLYKEEHPMWAKENGKTISRFKKLSV